MNNQKEKTFNDICFQFQQNFIDLFNNETLIPFLLKYYLINDIWKQILNHKEQLKINYTQNNYSQIKEKSITIPFKQPEKKEKEEQ